MSIVAPRVEPGRLLGLDVARGVAIVAMVIAHGMPFLGGVSRPVAIGLTQINDLASPLFAVVMGATAALAVQRARTSGVRGARRLIGHNVLRGLVLVALGIGLEQLNTWVVIILHMLGILLIVGTPLAFLTTRVQCALAALFTLVGPFAVEAVQRAAHARPGEVIVGLPPAWSMNRGVDWLILNPHYRVLTLVPLFLLGSVLYHWTRTRRACLHTVGIGVVVMIPWVIARIVRVDAVSGDLLDQSHETGMAIAAFGLLRLLDVAGSRWPRPLEGLARAIGGVGTVALSLYCFHVGLLVLLQPRFVDGVPWGRAAGVGWFLALLIPTVVVGWLWWRFLGKGPIERLIDVVVPRRVEPVTAPQGHR